MAFGTVQHCYVAHFVTQKLTGVEVNKNNSGWSSVAHALAELGAARDLARNFSVDRDRQNAAFSLFDVMGGVPIFAARALGGQRDIKSRRCLNEIHCCPSADPPWHLDAVGGRSHHKGHGNLFVLP